MHKIEPKIITTSEIEPVEITPIQPGYAAILDNLCFLSAHYPLHKNGNYNPLRLVKELNLAMQNLFRTMAGSGFVESSLISLDIIFNESIAEYEQLLMMKNLALVFPEVATSDIHISFKEYDKMDTKVMIMGVAAHN